MIRDTNQERKTITGSRLLCQAKGLRKDGKTHVIAVYEMSGEQYFFFTFTANKPRTPRRLWKTLNWHIIHDGRKYDPRGIDKTVTIQNFLDRQSYNLADGAKFKIRYPHGKRNFADLVERISNPDLTNIPVPAKGTWEYAAAISSGRGDRYQARKNAYGSIK